jgi:hypothetical protein
VLSAQLEGVSGGDRSGGAVQVGGKIIVTTETRRRGEKPGI